GRCSPISRCRRSSSCCLRSPSTSTSSTARWPERGSSDGRSIWEERRSTWTGSCSASRPASPASSTCSARSWRSSRRRISCRDCSLLGVERGPRPGALLDLSEDGRARPGDRRARLGRRDVPPHRSDRSARRLRFHRPLWTRRARPRGLALLEKGLLKMRLVRNFPLPIAAVALGLLLTSTPALPGASDEALSLVPADAISVGVVHFDSL